MARTRSPNYPSLNLEEAIDALRPILDKDHRNKMSRLTVAKHLGYNSLNGRSMAKISALRAYRLLEGSGDELRVSDGGLALIHAPADSRECAEALQNALNAPPLFRDLSALQGGDGVSKENLTWHLTQKGFTSDAAERAAQTYLVSTALASPKSESYNRNRTRPKMGDLVQREVDGVLKLEKPARVRAFQIKDGEEWAFIEGSKAGILVEELTVEQAASAAGIATSDPPVLEEPEAPPPSGVRQEITSLDEGDAKLLWPKKISEASYYDLEAWLGGVLRKARRRAGIKEQDLAAPRPN